MIQSKSNLANYLWGFLIVALLAWWLYHAGGSSRVAETGPVPTITAPELMRAYSENEIAADLKYKGKIMVVSGKVTARAKDIMDNIYVALFSARPLFSVQCFFNDSQARRIAAVQIGSQVRIQGRVDGKMGNVMLKDCRLVL